MRDKLIKLFQDKYWLSMTRADLENGFSSLTNNEKDVIINSLKYGDDDARLLIKNKLLQASQVYAENKADAVIASGVISLDLITDKL